MEYNGEDDDDTKNQNLGVWKYPEKMMNVTRVFNRMVVFRMSARSLDMELSDRREGVLVNTNKN